MREKIIALAVVIIAVAISAQSYFFWKFNNNSQEIARYNQVLKQVDVNIAALFQKLRDLKIPAVDKLLPKLPEQK